MAGTKVVVVNTKICLFVASVFVLKNLLYLKKKNPKKESGGVGWWWQWIQIFVAFLHLYLCWTIFCISKKEGKKGVVWWRVVGWLWRWIPRGICVLSFLTPRPPTSYHIATCFSFVFCIGIIWIWNYFPAAKYQFKVTSIIVSGSVLKILQSIFMQSIQPSTQWF